MKKIVLVILVLLSLGCSLVDVGNDIMTKHKIPKADIYYLDEFYGLKSAYDISVYLNEHIEYRSDVLDEWSTTEETLTRGYGDCEDFAIAFANIYYVVFGEKCDLVLVDTGNRVVDKGGYANHATINIPPSTSLLEVMTGEYVMYSPCFTYSFSLFFNI